MTLQYTPYALIAYASAAIAALMAGLIWSRRPGRGVISFVILMLALTEWAIVSGLEIAVTDLESKRIFSTFAYIGITIVPAAWFTFVLEYTGRERWLTRRTSLLLGIEPLLVLLTVATNPFHHLFWSDITLGMDGTIVYASYDYGSLFWIHAIYSYLILVVSAVFLINAFVRSPSLYRGQITFLLISQFAPWVGNFLYLSNMSPFPSYIDLTPLAFTVTGLSAGWSLYRFRLLDLVPVARDTVFESMSDAVVVLDSKNRMVDINQAGLKLLGRPAQDVMGKSIAEVIPNQQAVVEKYRNVTDIEDEIELKVGDKTYTFMMRLSPLKNRQGEVSGRTVVLHDISTMKEANRALVEAREQADTATQLKTQFLATMSHELRTPLNAIIGYTELQLTGMVGELSDIQYEYSERVLLNSKHLLSLINDILDISKIEAGRLDLAKQPIELQQWIDSIVTQNRILAEEKKLAFTVDLAAALPPVVYGDATRLRQVVVNLLSNAIKFTKEGSVLLSIQQNSSSTWQITVSDTGIGIPAHKQETIFDEFVQVDSSSTREYGGTGLGLAIVRKLVLLMGGTIRVSSTPGAGSTFTVILPLHTEIAEPVTA